MLLIPFLFVSLITFHAFDHLGVCAPSSSSESPRSPRGHRSWWRQGTWRKISTSLSRTCLCLRNSTVKDTIHKVDVFGYKILKPVLKIWVTWYNWNCCEILEIFKNFMKMRKLGKSVVEIFSLRFFQKKLHYLQWFILDVVYIQNLWYIL